MYEVGGRKQLFIDDRFIESQEGLSQRMNPPVKAGPALMPETEIENGSLGGYISIIEDPQVKGRYLMYYRATPKGESLYIYICLAVSEDGIRWERPRVGIFEINGSRDNNVVVPPPNVLDNFSVFLDPQAEDGCPFKMVASFMLDESKSAYAVYLWHSPDGIHWERLPEPALPFTCDTPNQCFYDSRLNKYVAYARGWDPWRVVKRTQIDNLLTFPWPYQENPEREKLAHGVYGYIRDELPTVIESDEADPPETDIYTPCVHLYPYADDVYVAFPSAYRHYDNWWFGQSPREHLAYDSHGRDHRGKQENGGVVDIQLAVSRDGVSFTRFREPYVGLGRIGEVDGGQLYMGLGMIRCGDNLYQYYGAYPTTHGEHGEELTYGEVIRLVQRLDGFVSVDAGHKGGELTTPVITFTGSRLQLNIDCSAMGEAWVELQDENGQPIPGFSESESVSVDRNGVAQEVWWHNGPDVSSLAGRPVRMRIKMRSAKLYAFQFVK